MKLEYTKLSNMNSIYPKAVEFELIESGNILVNSYSMDTSNVNNKITITLLDTINKQLSGTFKFQLVRDSYWSGSGDTIEFDSALFDIFFEERLY